MIAYFDTSAIVKILVDEEGTGAARDHWARASRALSSLVMYPETVASLAAARRNGRLDIGAHRSARDQFESMWAEMIPVACGLDTVLLAADLAGSDGLRGCDAIHLASALSVGLSELVFVAWDRDLSTAARRNGLAVTA
jgi:predicted nucleic acid-binding protein